MSKASRSGCPDAVLPQVNRKKKKKAMGQATVGSMRIITGSAAGRRLVSPPGEGTRPMMEKVRGAVFSMVASMAGSQPLLPPGSRWLDLFAGTGKACLHTSATMAEWHKTTTTRCRPFSNHDRSLCTVIASLCCRVLSCADTQCKVSTCKPAVLDLWMQ